MDALPPYLLKPPAYIKEGRIYVPKRPAIILPSEKQSTFPMPFFGGFVTGYSEPTLVYNNTYSSTDGGTSASFSVTGIDDSFDQYLVIWALSHRSGGTGHLINSGPTVDSNATSNWLTESSSVLWEILVNTYAWSSGSGSTCTIAWGTNNSTSFDCLHLYSLYGSNTGQPKVTSSDSDPAHTVSLAMGANSGACNVIFLEQLTGGDQSGFDTAPFSTEDFFGALASGHDVGAAHGNEQTGTVTCGLTYTTTNTNCGMAGAGWYNT